MVSRHPETDLSSVSQFHDQNQRSFDLLRVPVVGRLLTKKHARTLLQIPVFIVSVAMIAHGLFGPPLAPKNLATTFTWIHFRGLLVFVLASCLPSEALSGRGAPMRASIPSGDHPQSDCPPPHARILGVRRVVHPHEEGLCPEQCDIRVRKAARIDRLKRSSDLVVTLNCMPRAQPLERVVTGPVRPA